MLARRLSRALAVLLMTSGSVIYILFLASQALHAHEGFGRRFPQKNHHGFKSQHDIVTAIMAASIAVNSSTGAEKIKNAQRLARLQFYEHYSKRLRSKTWSEHLQPFDNGTEAFPSGDAGKSSSGADFRRLKNISQVSEFQAQRQAQMRKICKENRGLWRSSGWTYKYHRKKGFIYCPIPKAGWSSWKRAFFYINGNIRTMETDVGIANDKRANVDSIYEKAIHRLKNRVYKFVFVRNPWMRLISAYHNKAVDYNYSRILHTPCQWEKMTPYEQPISFRQFLECIAQDAEAQGQLRDEGRGSKLRLDMHWTPQWRLCDFCSISYNHIGHMETMKEDSEVVVNATRLNVKLPHVFYSKKKAADSARELYSDIPEWLTDKLKRLYKFDFLLHGYSFEVPS